MNKAVRLTAAVISLSTIFGLGGCSKGKGGPAAEAMTSAVVETNTEMTQSRKSEETSLSEKASDATDQGLNQNSEQRVESVPGNPAESSYTVSAEYNAEVGASYPMRYEGRSVYCYDPSTHEKKTGYVRINGIAYFFDPAMNGQLTDISVNDFFSKAVFIGNSTSEGLVSYFSSRGKDYLGGPLVAAKVSYTFNSDKSKLDGYMLKYKDEQLQAKELVKKAGSKYVLIMMGTNDLMGTKASSVAGKYSKYIEGIQQSNPGVVVFIQSTTPRRGKRNLDSLSNEKINELNKLMMEYADSHDNVKFIDISTPLMDEEGNMKQTYSSDGYVHLNAQGYGVWVNRVVDYIRAIYLEKAVDEARVSTDTSKLAGTRLNLPYFFR